MSEAPSYMVHWKARVVAGDKVVREGLISRVRQGGFNLNFEHAVSVGAPVSVEFYVRYRNQNHRLRAKTLVTYCMLKSQSSGSMLKLKIVRMPPDDSHTLNNILQAFMDSQEFDLQAQDG